MIVKEAIESLEYIKYSNDYSHDRQSIALDMAIEALNFQQEYKNTLWCNKTSCAGCKTKQTECVGYHKKLVTKYERSSIKKAIKLDSLQEEYQKKVKQYTEDLKYYLDTNKENGVVYIPQFVIEKIINKAIDWSEGE